MFFRKSNGRCNNLMDGDVTLPYIFILHPQGENLKEWFYSKFSQDAAGDLES